MRSVDFCNVSRIVGLLEGFYGILEVLLVLSLEVRIGTGLHTPEEKTAVQGGPIACIGTTSGDPYGGPCALDLAF